MKVCNKVREKERRSENFDELKKKILELCDTIDKQNDLIKKYQIALEIASVDIVKRSVDIVKSIEECVEECSVCSEQIYCEAHKHDTIHLDCGEMFLESWKKKAGIE